MGQARTLVAGLLGVIWLAVASGPAGAQAVRRDIPAPPQPPGAIVLQTPSGASAAATPESWTISSADNVPVVQNVSVPTVTPFLPAKGKANGAAVIIAPGGGFVLLAMDHEGWQVARWLQSHGVAAFVLKYRVLPTEPGAAGLDKAGAAFSIPAERARRLAEGVKIATEDAQAAMRMVRARAKDWGVDPARIGFMGFSAGAITTMNLAYVDDPATRPAFIAPVYGGLSAPIRPVPNAPPPMWAAMAADDPLFGKTDFALIPAWEAKGGAVELHLYERGGHGFGYPGRKGTSSTQWPSDFLAWLRARGLLGTSG
jgi:acetyl esterase/lipase